MPSAPATTLLVVLDGWGHREETDGNAIALARTPSWDALWAERPHCLVSGSGTDVGLPAGQMGNSEVGHTTLGAGRVVYQDLTRIDRAIADGSFQDNPVLNGLLDSLQCKGGSGKGGSLHLLGLLSPGGVHSHEAQMHALVDLARARGVKTIWMHAFLDGRDVPPKSAKASLAAMQERLQASGEGGIASLVGRYYAMDRDNRWDRIAAAWRLLARGEAEQSAATPEAGLEAAYARGETDEFVAPTLIGKPAPIADGDSVLFMNFRADRARQLTRCFVQPDFSAFDRGALLRLKGFATLTEYAADLGAPVAFPPETFVNSLGEYVASQGMSQLRLAETEKYAHVTFFFSGGREAPFPLEERILVPSPKVATYDQQPEMSAVQVTDCLVNAIAEGRHRLIVCNYANGDMVGHTGQLAASIKAVECLDACLARVVKALEASGGQCLITADHGNVERLADPATGQAHTAHTSEPVPLVYVGPQEVQLSADGGRLSDIAPSLLALMGLPQPKEMTGRSLILPKPMEAAHVA